MTKQNACANEVAQWYNTWFISDWIRIWWCFENTCKVKLRNTIQRKLYSKIEFGTWYNSWGESVACINYRRKNKEKLQFLTENWYMKKVEI